MHWILINIINTKTSKSIHISFSFSYSRASAMGLDFWHWIVSLFIIFNGGKRIQYFIDHISGECYTIRIRNGLASVLIGTALVFPCFECKSECQLLNKGGRIDDEMNIFNSTIKCSCSDQPNNRLNRDVLHIFVSSSFYFVFHSYSSNSLRQKWQRKKKLSNWTILCAIHRKTISHFEQKQANYRKIKGNIKICI